MSTLRSRIFRYIRIGNLILSRCCHLNIDGPFTYAYAQKLKMIASVWRGRVCRGSCSVDTGIHSPFSQNTVGFCFLNFPLHTFFYTHLLFLLLLSFPHVSFSELLLSQFFPPQRLMNSSSLPLSPLSPPTLSPFPSPLLGWIEFVICQ